MQSEEGSLPHSQKLTTGHTVGATSTCSPAPFQFRKQPNFLKTFHHSDTQLRGAVAKIVIRKTKSLCGTATKMP
jgi:hypothetical protein